MKNLFRSVALMGAGILIGIAGMASWSALGALAQTPAKGGCQAFSQTQRTVCGLFLDYWNTHGGLAQQGYPLSDEFQEKSDLDGKTYTVQYFERAVFEYHAENQPPYNVLLSQLGTFRAHQKYPNGFPQGQSGSGNTAPFYEDRTSPAAMLQSYYNAINRKEYKRAYSYFTGSPNPAPDVAPPYDQFVKGYSDTANDTLLTGQYREDPGAGNIYANVPVALTATKTDGSKQVFYGCYTTHRVNDGISPNPDDVLWHINKATLKVAPANVPTDTLLAQGCPNIYAWFPKHRVRM